MTIEFTSAWEASSTYDRYLDGSADKASAWHETGARVELTTAQVELLGGFTRAMRVLVVSGAWCGDCVRQGPSLAAIAEACPVMDLRWIDRDHRASPIEHLEINAGRRVPVVVFMAEDGAPVSVLGDRTLSYYRWLAAQKLGPACPLPGASVPGDVLASITQDWIDQCERVHLLLRLSPRLRERHAD